MKLGSKQRLFTSLVARLLVHLYLEGYEATFGDANRSKEEATRLGFPNSNHTRRLAIDLNLFKDGKYLSSTESHRLLGEWWEAQHELCRWGGRFGDGNHYSLIHGKVI
mgnify:CR=1 FL=1|jgi:hypothetical protein